MLQLNCFLIEVFVKIAEESRRHRALLLDMGDESAKLKFLVSAGKGGAPKGEAGAKGKGKGPFGPMGMGMGPMGPMPPGPMNPMTMMANMAMKGGKGPFMPYGKGAWKGKWHLGDATG